MFAKSVIVLGEVDGNVTASREGRHPRQRLGRRRHHLAARGDRRRRALPRQHRHAAPGRRGQGRRQGADVKPRRSQRRKPREPGAAAATPAAPRRSASRSVSPARHTGRLGSRPPPGATRDRFHVPAQGSGRPLTDRLSAGTARRRSAGRAGVRASPSEHVVADQGVQPKFLVRAVAAGIAGRCSTWARSSAATSASSASASAASSWSRTSTPTSNRTSRRRRRELAAFVEKRFPQADGSVDGVLCWDVLDYPRQAPRRRSLAREMMRVLKPGGAVFGFFCNDEASTRRANTRVT